MAPNPLNAHWTMRTNTVAAAGCSLQRTREPLLRDLQGTPQWRSRSPLPNRRRPSVTPSPPTSMLLPLNETASSCPSPCDYCLPRLFLLSPSRLGHFTSALRDQTDDAVRFHSLCLWSVYSPVPVVPPFITQEDITAIFLFSLPNSLRGQGATNHGLNGTAMDEAPVDGELPRRSSIEKHPILSDRDIDDIDDDLEPSALDRLPEEIIQQVLEAADPSTFASLILVSSKWRSASQQGRLYALQLMRCPSYSASHKKPPNGAQENLPALRRLFAREVKRNLFDAYLRPNHTIVKIVSNSISSSSCPGGDGMSFSPSPKGHFLLAYNSSRINIIDLRGPTLKVERELKILRRPAATCVKDDGSLLAVLLTEMQVDLYDLTQTPPKRTQSIILDHSPRTIALSPCGTVLAAAYEGGIEVQSLGSGALPTDRRSVKCDAVDALAFSFDGTQILGTTIQSAQPNTVVLTAPYYDPGSHLSSDNISALWTTSILFPNTSRDCSHAVLIQESAHDEAAYAFTYDRSFETFRAVRIDDLRNGTTYFTGPIPNTPLQAKLLPCTLPAASVCGDLVSAGFQGKEVWLYGVPEDLEAVPDASNNNLDVAANSSGVHRRVSGGSMRSRTQEAGEARVPQWQLLCDKLRNTFVEGFKVTDLSGVSTVKWVAGFGDSSMKERLVIAAKGAVPAKPITEEDGMDFEDGGRLTLVDFDYGLEDGHVAEITIEVGLEEPEILEEEHRDMATEVAIVRRRTVAQRRGPRSAIMRAATTAARPTPASATEEEDDDDDPLVPRRIGEAPPRPPQPPTATEETETATIIEEQEALDAPYSHTGPRSITTLRRAATAAANHRRLNPTTTAGTPVEYRRADGRAEHPHESDADNWVPPPPPYQKEDPEEAPAFLRHSMVPVLAMAESQPLDRDLPPVPPIPQAHRILGQDGATPGTSQSRPSRRHTLAQNRMEGAHQRRSQSAAQQRFSMTDPVTVIPSNQVSPNEHPSNTYEEEDIYNVSPPETPQLQATRSLSTQQTASPASPQSLMRSGSEPSPALTEASPYTGTQRVMPLVPRIQTTSARPLQPQEQQSAAERPIPGASPANSTWNPHTGGGSYPTVIHSQTWPIPPPSSVMPEPGSTEYPHSAPPMNVTANERITRHHPPLPVQEQPPVVRDNGRQSSLSRRLSTGFHLPRVPTSRSSERARPMSVHQPSGYRTVQTASDLQHQSPPQYPYARSLSDPSSMTHTIDHALMSPDQPLIISTPTGVSGAYDGPTRQPSDRRTETTIFAPIPRHPRPSQNPGVLRPTAQQLEGQLNPAFLPASAAPAPGLNSRLSSVNRRSSRAERSAAKNISDAKKKGWRPGRSKSKKGKKGKKKEPDFDVMSQSAWTDATWSTAGRGRNRRTYNFGGAGAGVAENEKDKKCIVM
ncbi:F-box domain-containing protein [Diaporthe amygdali]|uniref:F-box domain-containing protein n=1 Tax=Phomopsis amygdali TaxID=1214568 RepID=UPI0022FEA229|nr:F-box domain-containing protein [Diaporthe amygdali]KAJ0121309.1 F-box domain-containing protein [Diaporthe amygdali]